MAHFFICSLREEQVKLSIEVPRQCLCPGGHSLVKNTGGWLDSLGSGILFGKGILGFFKNIYLDNS